MWKQGRRRRPVKSPLKCREEKTRRIPIKPKQTRDSHSQSPGKHVNEGSARSNEKEKKRNEVSENKITQTLSTQVKRASEYRTEVNGCHGKALRKK